MGSHNAYGRTPRERLLARVNLPDDPDACWLWTGPKTKAGYGNLIWQGVYVLAHRLVWTLFRGPTPEGKELDHLCRVRHCVNPSHLEPVSHRLNSLRGARPNAARYVCVRGHPFDGYNGRQRTCSTCRRRISHEWQQRQKVVA